MDQSGFRKLCFQKLHELRISDSSAVVISNEKYKKIVDVLTSDSAWEKNLKRWMRKKKKIKIPFSSPDSGVEDEDKIKTISSPDSGVDEDELFIPRKGLGMEASGMPGANSSTPPDTPLDDNERPGSSLSTASRSSRIPRLNRSASLRIKSSSSTPDGNKTTTDGKSRSDPHHRGASKSASRGIVRSASFVTSRGMGSLSSPSGTSFSNLSPSYHQTSTPCSSQLRTSSSRGPSLTPELPRRRFSHNSSSSYSRRSSAVIERKTRASQPDTPSRSPDTDLDDVGEEADSVKSFGSVSSAMSCDTGLAKHNLHGNHHHNGTGSSSTSCWGGGGRNPNPKYVLHCRHNHEMDPDKYLTPTQRAARKIRELKSQLAEARRDVHVRDEEISRLTRELVELRLLKARTQQEESANAVGDRRKSPVDMADGATPNHRHPSTVPSSATTTTPTPKTSATPSEGSEPELSRLMDNMNIASSTSSHHHVDSPTGGSVAETTEGSVDLTRSLADSGHYDDLTSPCLSSRDPFEASRSSLRDHPIDEDEDDGVNPWAAIEEAESRMREEYVQREDLLKRNHMDEYHELKEKHNDRVESLLAKLSDANLKYFELRPLYDRSQERIRELERDIGKLKDELTEAELRHQKMYLQMFLKGQQAAKLQAEDDQDFEVGSQSSLNSTCAPIVDLLKQLSRTEEELEKIKVLYQREVANRAALAKSRNGELDPEVTLQFLKSAIYYFLTDKDNSKGHLRAIESILGYTDSERLRIDRVMK